MSGVDGTATFFQRNNGNTLVEITLEGTPDEGQHPVYITNNEGEQAIYLDAISGATGMGRATIRQFNDGASVSYEQLLGYSGYLGVALSPTDATPVAQGGIGQNGLTGNEVTYEIVPVDNSGISGTATFAQRRDSSSLVTIVLNGAVPGNSYPAFIQTDSVASENIIVALNSINGTTEASISTTIVEERGKWYEDTLRRTVYDERLYHHTSRFYGYRFRNRCGSREDRA